MQILFSKIAFEDNKSCIKSNLILYNNPIDSYYEDHIIESCHYLIRIDNVIAGYVSVFENGMVTQFSLRDEYLSMESEIFNAAKSELALKTIYVSTCDNTLLRMALENQKTFEVQDYVFHFQKAVEVPSDFTIRKANISDITSIRENHDGFFQNLEQNIDKGEIYLGYSGPPIVSYGIIEKSKLFDDWASIGMFVVKNERGKAYGSYMVKRLVEKCLENNVVPIAGCFSKNTHSKNALCSAGTCSTNWLLKAVI